ncbi:hypothetical protein [Croceivirga sp. JEA036]|nr:hypothetical protein [Croceivirga sp. JEA036]
MNTKKLIFGLLAVVTLVASSLSTTILTEQNTNIKKGTIGKIGPR